MPEPAAAYGLYVHIPFCPQKCHYCDFNSYPLGEEPTQPYVDALVAEIESTREALGPDLPTFGSVFFGGGTPTTLEPAQLRQVLSALRRCFTLDPDAEITSEANPGTVTPEKLEGMLEAGINRLSLGVQALDDRLLRILGRVHDEGKVHQAVAVARKAGFRNLSLDLMFGLPEQTLEDWSRTLEGALALRPEHLSMYSLIVEPKTAFWRWRERGRLPLPDDEEELAMYELAMERAAQEGYRHYEISNYALPGMECRHNLVYWRNDPYLGFGAGAVSYWEGRRRTNVLLPRGYVARVREGRPLTVEEEVATPLESLGETMMLGLRLLEGVDLGAARRRHGIDPAAHYSEHIDRMRAAGLLQIRGERLALTPKGLPLANAVWSGFVA